MSLPAASSPVQRLLYKQLLAGDFRKLTGTSNNAPKAGGGARDIRLPYTAFDPVFAELLPGIEMDLRKEAGIARRVMSPVRTGPVHVTLASGPAVETMRWERPTPSRPTEGRIPTVHEVAATSALLAAQTAAGDSSFLLIVQDHSGQLRVHAAHAADLRSGKWAEQVAKPILAHLDSPRRRRDRAACGYLDFTDGTRYAHELP